MTADPGTPAEAARPAYRDPNALRWVFGYLSSLIGDQIWFVALAWSAVQVGTPGEVGLVLAAGSVPRSVLLLFGGALADRWGVRRTAIGSDAVRGVLLLLAAALALALPLDVVWLVLLAIAFGVVDAVFLPAAAAMPQQLASADQMTRLQGMRATAQRLATTLGAPLGGLVVAAAGAGLAFAAAAAAAAVSVVALRFTHVRPQPRSMREPVTGAVRAGLGYTVRHPILMPLMLMATLSEFGFGGAINAGLPILSHARGWGANGVGILLGAFGIGAATAALAVVIGRRIVHVGRLFPPLILIMAAAVAGIGSATALPVAGACAAVVGIAAGLTGALYGSLILTQSDPAMLARVASLSTLASLGLAPITLALSGAAATTLGPSAPFRLGAAVATLAILPPLMAPALRRAQFATQ
jgi:hypothetical protein